MDERRILSGEELVKKGVTKYDASLPETGIKDVVPNGSWLEQKQIQAALEARKHLVEVERIEKYGTLSHAEWRDNLKLAEVTQQSGGYWQYMGHHIGKKLYLNPEEALFLIEVNCLLLKHGEVPVSLQKAYSLLLCYDVTVSQYKVYASLSRLGYKVFRHNKNIINMYIKEDSVQGVNPEKNVENSIEAEDSINSEVINLDVDKALDIHRKGTSDEVELFEGTDTDTDVDRTSHVMEVIENTISNVVENVDTQKTNTANEPKNKSEPGKGTHETVKLFADIKTDVLMDCTSHVMEVKQNKISNVGENVDNQETNAANEQKNNPKPGKGTSHEALELFQDTEMDDDKTSHAMEVIENTISNVVENDYIKKSNAANKQQTNPEPENNTENDANDPLPSSEQSMAVIEGTSSEADIEMTIEEDQIISEEVNSGEKVQMDTEMLLIDEIEMRVEKPRNNSKTDQIDIITVESENYYSFNKVKLQKLKTRQENNTRSLHNMFDTIPDLYNQCVVTVKVPSEDHIPKNVFTYKLSYEINMDTIKTKYVRPESVETTYSSNDDVNIRSVRRIRSASNDSNYIVPVFSCMRFPRHLQFRQPNHWRPYYNTNEMHDFHYNNMFYQRTYAPSYFDHHRFSFIPRSFAPMFRPFPPPPRFNPNMDHIRSRLEHIRARHDDRIQQIHLESLKTLITKLKRLILAGNTRVQNVQSFQRILNAYNKRYKTKMRLTDNYDLVDDENILETIEIVDDSETAKKKPCLRSKTNNYNCNLNNLKQIALKLKLLEENSQAVAAHRRALSNTIKVFNQRYNADVYLNEEHELKDRKHITLDSSSDSDCVIDEPPIVPVIKKLRNPFNMFKRLLENIESNSPDEEVECSMSTNGEPKENVFDKNWLPGDDDFGKAEVPPKNLMNARLLDSYQHDFLFDFIFQREESQSNWKNWVDLKISFLNYLEELNSNKPTPNMNNYTNGEMSGLRPIIKPEDCSDMPVLLEKLRIIPINKDVDAETNLAIDFDVYNRDVPNFRKTNPPKPHFRVICTEKSSQLPTSSDVLSLHVICSDNVPTVFAVVGSSVSYLQINNCDIPIYVSRNDLP